MAKKSPIKIDDFFKLSAEEQAKAIERETKKVLGRLPSLKKSLSVYNDTSNEMYNWRSDEIETIGMTYARAVRTGSITTPTGKQAYQHFVQNLRKYARTSIKDLALGSAKMRMESFMKHIRENSKNPDEIEKANMYYEMMSDSDILGFTRSKLFLDVGDWGSDQFQKFIQDYEYSISFVKFQEYLKQKGYDIDEIYVSVKKKG